MRWYPVLIAPLALAHAGCSTWLRAGPQGRVIDKRAAVEASVTAAGGIESLVFPLSLSAGVTPDDGEDLVSLGFGAEGITRIDEGPWGYVIGSQIVGELSGPSGTSVNLGGGPYLELDSGYEDYTVLHLNLNAGPGLSGDIQGDFVGGVNLTIETLHRGRFNLPHGRPLRGADGVMTAELCERSDWLDPIGLMELSAAEQSRRGERWLSSALDEHASIVAFERLAADLHALGAPAALVLEAERAREDEIRHARTCFSIASTYLGREWGPGRLDVPSATPPDPARLAYESVVDGCAGEGMAALLAASRAARARDPVVRTALEEVSREEARHAALGASVAAFCRDVGGEEAERAIARGFNEAREKFWLG